MATQSLRHTSFAYLPGLIPEHQLACLQAYAEELFPLADRLKHDEDGYHMHSECAIATFFNHQLTRLVETLSGEPLRPHAGLWILYGPGRCEHASGWQSRTAATQALTLVPSLLGVHRDREGTVFSMSIAVLKRGLREAVLRVAASSSDPTFRDLAPTPGDGVVFRGRVLPHYRPMVPPGTRLAVLVLSWESRAV